jgi:hypothetical protein
MYGLFRNEDLNWPSVSVKTDNCPGAVSIELKTGGLEKRLIVEISGDWRLDKTSGDSLFFQAVNTGTT